MRPCVFLTVCLPLLLGATCQSHPTPKEQQASVANYNLGIEAQKNNDLPGALRNFDKAIELDPCFDQAHNAKGVLLHLGFHKPEDAIKEFKRALECNPKFSDADVNLGNVYLDQSQFDEAIACYKHALDDMLFRTPYIPENNMGWALYKKGQTDEAIAHIKAALVHNPKFCQSWRNLGIIATDQKRFDKARDDFQEYVKDCPDQCDAHAHLAKTLLSLGDQAGAKTSLESCSKAGASSECGTECRHLLELMK